MELDLRQVIRIAKRSWWILILAPLVSGATAFAIGQQQTPQYEAAAMIRINPPASEVLDLNVLRLTQDLTETYRRLITTRPVLQEVIENLGLDLSVSELAGATSSTAIAGTQLVRIEVSNPDPVLAALIANTIASSFAARVNGGAESSVQTEVTLSEPAVPPEEPYTPKVLLNAALGVAAGVVVAVSFVVLRQGLDNAVRDQQEVQQLTDAPVLARVGNAPHQKRGPVAPFAVTLPRSPATEAIRLLRTNLDFMGGGKGISTLAVTSPEASEGKSTVAANLAVVIAQSGKSTVLIDADLRRPTQHRNFQVSNVNGLSNLLTYGDRDWKQVAVSVSTPNLRLVPSGPIPPNPTDLLNLGAFGEFLWAVAQDVDMVIVDTPPVQAVTDALIVARQTGSVILVARPGFTRREPLRASAEALRSGGVRLLGIVLNRQDINGDGAYYYEYYDADDPRRHRFQWWRRSSAP